jgi:hypothetical protein
MIEWRKSSRSETSVTAMCVEVADLDGATGVRDSKNPGPVLRFTPAEMAAFAAAVKRGDHDL